MRSSWSSTHGQVRASARSAVGHADNAASCDRVELESHRVRVLESDRVHGHRHTIERAHGSLATSTDEVSRQSMSQAINQSTSRALHQLHSHMTTHKSPDTPVDHSRYGQAMLLLASLKQFDSDILVELFFSNLIGDAHISSVIPFILKMDITQVMNQNESVN